ncbi:MAG: hypothetical protein UEJ45_05325 [Peptococcaceae bacterium]|nr:hypothetical protein [Peptococcaceae bacterium]
MLVKSMTEKEIHEIGHAFGYYDYGQETRMTAAFSGQEKTAEYHSGTPWTRKKNTTSSSG